MSPSDQDRLLEILDAISAIHGALVRGPLTDGLIFGAARVRLIKVGEAVKDVGADQPRGTAARFSAGSNGCGPIRSIPVGPSDAQ